MNKNKFMFHYYCLIFINACTMIPIHFRIHQCWCAVWLPVSWWTQHCCLSNYLLRWGLPFLSFCSWVLILFFLSFRSNCWSLVCWRWSEVVSTFPQTEKYQRSWEYINKNKFMFHYYCLIFINACTMIPIHFRIQNGHYVPNT
jgi:hypothetical protein